MQIQKLLQQRKERGYEIAKTAKITEKNGIWLVPSQTNPRQTYQVTLTLTGATCTCKDYEERGIKCKHYWSVEYALSKQINKDGTITRTITKKATYPQAWHEYDLANTQQKDLFQKLLHDLCNTIIEPTPKATGRPSLPIADMVFTSALKVYTNFSLRRFMCDVKEAQKRGYIEAIPHFTIPSKYMRKGELTPILHQLITASALPLKAVESSFSIDSTGFTPSKFSRWFDKKYGKTRDRKIWYKLHLVNGNATHIVASCEVTSQHIYDGTMLEELTIGTHQNFNMQELSADKGYLSDNNLQHLNGLGIASYIPFKTNTVANNEKKSPIWRNAYNYFAFNQADFLEHYHQRSNTETVMYMVKTKFGDYTKSKDNTACINEILLKVLFHNICVLISEMFELGIKPEFLGS
jgi:transposase